MILLKEFLLGGYDAEIEFFLGLKNEFVLFWWEIGVIIMKYDLDHRDKYLLAVDVFYQRILHQNLPPQSHIKVLFHEDAHFYEGECRDAASLDVVFPKGSVGLLEDSEALFVEMVEVFTVELG